jgi:hypothetical protein
MFILILVIILIIFFVFCFNTDRFTIYPYNYPYNYPYYNYPYNYPIDNPLANYKKIIKKINLQQQYKKDLSTALSPIPTIQCQELTDKDTCNKYGCNWFGTQCSSMYPIDY